MISKTPSPDDNPKTEVTVFDDVDAEEITPPLGALIPVLMCLNHPELYPIVVIDKPIVFLGRSDDCHIQLERHNISRIHAVIRTTTPETPGAEPVCVIEDRGSKNGTYINKRRVSTPTQLKNGDSLVLGDLVFAFFVRRETELAMEKRIHAALSRHSKPSGPRRLPSNMEATLRIVIPEVTFTPTAVKGFVKDIDLRGLRFVTHEISRDLWKMLIQKEKYLQCEIRFPDESDETTLAGRMAWIHYDNKTKPENCAMGVEFKNITPEKEEFLRSKLPPDRSLQGETPLPPSSPPAT